MHSKPQSSLTTFQSELASIPTPSSRISSRSLGVSARSSHSMAIPNPDSNLEKNVQNFLNTSMCSKHLTVSADKLGVKHTGPSNGFHVGAIQANWPALHGELLFYFEMTVKDHGETGAVGIGFTGEHFQNFRMPNRFQIYKSFRKENYVSK